MEHGQFVDVLPIQQVIFNMFNCRRVSSNRGSEIPQVSMVILFATGCSTVAIHTYQLRRAGLTRAPVIFSDGSQQVA